MRHFSTIYLSVLSSASNCQCPSTDSSNLSARLTYLKKHRKIKSYQIGVDEIPSDFGRYGTPIDIFKHLNSFLLASQVAQLLSTLASVSYFQLGWRATISWKLFSPNWRVVFTFFSITQLIKMFLENK